MALVVCFNFVFFRKWVGSTGLFACICLFLWLGKGGLRGGVCVL